MLHDPNSTPTTRRFSEGVEELPETPSKVATRRFSEGVEQGPAVGDVHA